MLILAGASDDTSGVLTFDDAEPFKRTQIPGAGARADPGPPDERRPVCPVKFTVGAEPVGEPQRPHAQSGLLDPADFGPHRWAAVGAATPGSGV
jgi:hypothetical protein